MNSVAAQLVGSQTPLGVIPAGTLNHFARDVGVGRHVEEALRVLARGYVLPVDVAKVNDRIFLNNSSIGLYARMVEMRKRLEPRAGKWRALMYAGWLTIRKAHPSTVQISSDKGSERVRTYLVFVGNNQYELELLRLGQRARLDAGQLCCFILEGPSRLGLLPYVFGYLRDHRHHQRAAHHVFHSLCTDELTVRTRRRVVDVACDGEVFRLEAPLVYRVLPRALRVVVPKPPPPESREARSEAG
jgi:diacylglycerol kinase family enzyme